LHETEYRFHEGIEVADLPKAFQEAVMITRKLGYKYMWIDSLCIIQASARDWEVQAKVMGNGGQYLWVRRLTTAL
jgi:hypothetical protein